jgi:hypothetical protein
LFPGIICAAFHFNEWQGDVCQDVTLQSKLAVLSGWFHDGVITDRDDLLRMFRDMTPSGERRGRGYKVGYDVLVVSCAMTMGKEAAAELARLWPTTSMATAYLKLPWVKLKDDVPRQVLRG